MLEVKTDATSEGKHKSKAVEDKELQEMQVMANEKAREMAASG